jgi:uncharacterized protein (DUF302 family)
MSYYFAKTLALPFANAVTAVRDALKAHGFGVITEIDVQATLKAKIGVEFRPYIILGACNPALAHEALTIEDKVGTMLPCNVVVQALPSGMVEVAAIDPVASMRAIENPELHLAAEAVAAKLRAVIADL